jgi:hypothetical protein
MLPISAFNMFSPPVPLLELLSSGQYLLSFENNPPHQKTETPRMTRKERNLLLEEALDIIAADIDPQKPVEINKLSSNGPASKPGSVNHAGRAAPSRTRCSKFESAFAA